MAEMAPASTKPIPAASAAAFREALELVLQRDFGGNQSKAAKWFGFSQAHLSDLLHGKKTPGLALVLKLHERAGRSLEALLGLPEPEPQFSPALLEKLADALAQRSIVLPPAKHRTR